MGSGCSYKKLAEDVKKGSQILCADGSIVLEVIDTDPAAGIVTCKCQNNAKLGCATIQRVFNSDGSSTVCEIAAN